MRDDTTFETRLADAFGRLAAEAPPMDDDAIARAAIDGDRGGWLSALRRGPFDREALGRPMLRSASMLIVLALILAAIAIVVTQGALRDGPVPPLGHNGQIVFTVQGNSHEAAVTYAMDPDGTDDHSVRTERCPTYSRDGSALAFVSYVGSATLIARHAEGGPIGTVLFVDDPTTAVTWALSPDGTRVAWFKPDPSGDTESQELWVAPTDGGPGVRIVPASADPNETYKAPLWSPDGNRIVFGGIVADADTLESHRSAIYVVGADGTGLRRLTDRPASRVEEMSWSPDSRFLAYIGVPDDGLVPPTADDGSRASLPDDVFVIGIDGSGDRNLTESPGFESRPAWSPDGAAIAFATTAAGSTHRLTTIRMDGPSPIGPTVPGPESEWFLWSPDGTELLWLESTQLDPETYRSTFHTVDPGFRRSSRTLLALDGQVVCTPSWQRLEP